MIVDDSLFLRKALVRILSADPRMRVVGVAASGEELLEKVGDWRPDVVTLDLAMPGMGGLQTLDKLMQRRPTPVIVLSSHARESAPLTIEALHRGAVDFIDKQRYSLLDFSSLGNVLIDKIVEVTGVAGRPAARTEAPRGKRPAEPPIPPATVREWAPPAEYEVILVGASTGGPLAIQRLLEDLGPDVRLPVVVVQHMPVGFTRAFAERLNSHLPLAVREAADGEALLPATVYVAPAGSQLVLRRRGGRLVARLEEGAREAAHRPSVNELFSSAEKEVGPRAIAVLLTGMGTDGAEGMAGLAAAGAHTLAQDSATSVVFGMPRAAVKLEAAREVLPLHLIGGRLRELLGSPE